MSNEEVLLALAGIGFVVGVGLLALLKSSEAPTSLGPQAGTFLTEPATQIFGSPVDIKQLLSGVF